MYTGSIPPASIFATWIESIEISSADDGQLVDLSSLTEITLKLRDPRTFFDELVLRLTDGNITLPSTGIIQWRAELTQMASLVSKTYDVLLILYDGDITVDLVLGSISILQ